MESSSTSLLKAALTHRGLPLKSAMKRENEYQNNVKQGTNSNVAGQPVVKKPALAGPPPPVVKRSCLCAPTTHPGSFRCRFHRSKQRQWGGKPLNSPVRSLPRPTSSEVVPSVNSRAVLPPKKFVLKPPLSRSSLSCHEARPSRLSRMETAASPVSFNSEKLSSSRSSSRGSVDEPSQLETEALKPEKDPPQAERNEGSESSSVKKEVEITSNTSAILEDDYRCALKVIQISQQASEVMESARDNISEQSEEGDETL